MSERPYSRYTREKTWAALYSQHINAQYALVPCTVTTNSIAIIRCKSPDEAATVTQDLLDHEEECRDWYVAYVASMQEEDKKAEGKTLKVPERLKRARLAVVLARSSYYYHYSLYDHKEFKLVICGLHDSYLPLPVWEMRTNQRYAARATSVQIGSAEFDRIRFTVYGHNILLGALANGDAAATAYRDTHLPERTKYRLNHEADELQGKRYRGRPLAFLTEEERREISSKISEGLKRYHAQKRKRA